MVSADRTRDVVEPTADDALACVRAAVGRVMEVAPESVAAQLRLVEDLGADSLAIIEMAELMEDEMARRFRVRVAVNDVALVRTRTVAGLADELWRSFSAMQGPRAVGRTTPWQGPRET